MSKSLGNVVNPDKVVDEFGADALRLYEMFMGPLDQGKVWDTNGSNGVARFLRRAWHAVLAEDGSLAVQAGPGDRELDRAMHRCLARVARESDYRVLVPGWRPTSSFELSQSPASVKLELAPASELHSVLGQVLGWTGALSLVAGLVTVLVSDSRTGDVVGLSVAGGGALALGIGIPLAISGSHSSVDPVPIARAPTTLVLRGAF
jgi:hypothetical protein